MPLGTVLNYKCNSVQAHKTTTSELVKSETKGDGDKVCTKFARALQVESVRNQNALVLCLRRVDDRHVRVPKSYVYLRPRPSAIWNPHRSTIEEDDLRSETRCATSLPLCAGRHAPNAIPSATDELRTRVRTMATWGANKERSMSAPQRKSSATLGGRGHGGGLGRSGRSGGSRGAIR